MKEHLYLDADTANDFRYGINVPESHLEVVHDEQIDSGRWDSFHELVLLDPHNDTYWRATYTLGLTEDQEDDGFELRDGQVRFTRVVQRPYTAYRYVEWESEDD